MKWMRVKLSQRININKTVPYFCYLFKLCVGQLRTVQTLRDGQVGVEM